MRNLEKHIEQKLLPFRENRLVVGCSGGLDSMVLAEILRRLGFRIELAHVNYHFRGADSDADENCVRSYAEKWALPFHVHHADPADFSSNLQAQARAFRYDWFQKICAQGAGSFVVLAHHANDQVETFFLQLARNAGMMGLACMPFQRDHILRPMLEVSKEGLHTFALIEKLEWREDASNAKLLYRRNAVRHLFLPQVKQEIPEIEDSILLLIQHFQKVQKELEEHIRPIATTWISTQELSLQSWSAFTSFEKIELLRQIKQAAAVMESVDKLVGSIKGSRALLQSEEFAFSALVRTADSLRLIPREPIEQQLFLQTNIVPALPVFFDKMSVYLNAEKIKGSLKLRPWKIGDRMEPLGMKGSQLISDIIAAAKIPEEEKKQVFILHDEETVHWCVGLKVGRLAVANKKTARIVHCTISRSKSPK